MKFVHFSDTHLGFSDYFRIDPKTGINQREQDFYNAWNFVINQILQIKPDFVIHAGDLFHTSRPTNRAIAIALEGIQKICDSNIQFVAISGNHSTPKIRATGSIFESISLLPKALTAYQSKYEKFVVGDSAVHCVPHCSLTEELQQSFSQLSTDNQCRFNILVSHGSWAGEKLFSMGEFNEQHIQDPELLNKIKFDYIALGHYHKHIKIKPHVIYSGSTERTSFNEAGNPTGFMVVDLNNGEFLYHKTPSRPMIKLPPIDCYHKTTNEIYEELQQLSTEKLRDALVSIHLHNIQHDTFLKLENRQIDEIFQHVFYLNKSILSTISDKNASVAGFQLSAVNTEFERYIENLPDGELDKNRIKTLGLNYLTKEKM